MQFIHYFGLKGLKLPHSTYDPNLLGNKGANLAYMSDQGFNVPPGFILSSSLCQFYYKNNKTLPENFDQELQKAVHCLEENSGKILGSSSNPLLFSVRSGAKVSMPGMMDTILNVGITQEICDSLAKNFNPYFALDTYRRFLQMYGALVLKISSSIFTQPDSLFKNDLKYLQQIVKSFYSIIQLNCKEEKDHMDVFNQLKKSIIAVLDSWNVEKAITYRDLYNIPADQGTAVIVQNMVFGNMNNNSGTGVVFSRNPIDGSKEIYGEFLLNAQGEDIVSGSFHPISINDKSHPAGIIKQMPKIYDEIKLLANKLEKHYKNVQDIEFTVQNNKLYILQTRNAKSTAAASIKIAIDHTKEGLISKKEALLRVRPGSLAHLMHPSVNYTLKPQIICSGLPASPGAAYGRIVFSAEEAEAASKKEPVVLVRIDTSPEDIRGMHFASALLTSKGGFTSHAAVIARGMGKPCVSGAKIEIDVQKRLLKVKDFVLNGDSYLTIDGSTGNIILGQSTLLSEQLSPEFSIFMSWVDEFRTMKVRANAENIQDLSYALKFGAEGIGLVRSEHMLFEPERLKLIRKIILVSSFEQRSKCIRDLFKLHKKDFKEIFTLLGSIDINIRLFDPPLHEFVNLEDAAIIAQNLEIDYDFLVAKIKAISEKNPMLGKRGVRLGITYPELYEMQAEAIFEAAIELKNAKNINVNLEIMIPFVCDTKEVVLVSNLVKKIANKLQEVYGQVIEYKLGIMIELPRAALLADQLVEYVDFFSFGTNDLTQAVFGISRDDFSPLDLLYKDLNIFDNPFMSIDRQGVGQIMEIACKKARSIKPNLSFSVCGEHGGDPKSIDFFNTLNINYVSCSPFRILIAKLAAAQSVIKLSNS